MSRTPGPPRSARPSRGSGSDRPARRRRRSLPARRSDPAAALAPSPLGYGRHGQTPPRFPDRPPRSRHRPFEELVEWALDAIPEPYAAALDEVAVVIADEPTDDQRRENDIGPDETLYGLYEGVPRTEWGADWARDPEPDHALPPAARGGLRRPGRPRRRGLGDGHPRARASPRDRRRPTDRARRRLTGDRAVSRCATRMNATRPTIAGDEAASIGRVSQRNRRWPGRGISGSRSPPGRTWSSPNVARVSPTNITTCGAMRDGQRRVDERPEREDADGDADDDEDQPGRPGIRRRARAHRTPAGRRRGRRQPEEHEQERDGLEDRDQGGRDLARPEHPERAAGRLDRAHVAEDDAGEHVRERRPDQRGDERRRQRTRHRSGDRGPRRRPRR